jgi:hypothetical protein
MFPLTKGGNRADERKFLAWLVRSCVVVRRLLQFVRFWRRPGLRGQFLGRRNA